jgi:hypothetical protein
VTDDIAARFPEYVFLDRKRAREAFESLDQLGDALITNVSRGDLFVATEHQNLGPRGAPQRGLGFRFAEVEGAPRNRLDALYERALQTAASRRR